MRSFRYYDNFAVTVTMIVKQIFIKIEYGCGGHIYKSLFEATQLMLKRGFAPEKKPIEPS